MDKILARLSQNIEDMKQANKRAVDTIGKPENRTFKLPHE